MRPAAAARSQRRPRRGAALRPGRAGAEAAPLPSAGPLREAAGKAPEEEEEEGSGEGAGGDAACPLGGCGRAARDVFLLRRPRREGEQRLPGAGWQVGGCVRVWEGGTCLNAAPSTAQEAARVLLRLRGVRRCAEGRRGVKVCCRGSAPRSQPSTLKCSSTSC